MSYAIPIQLQHAFVTITCYKCGVIFAVDDGLKSNWQRDKTEFFCPNGHGQSYTESEADRLKRELTTAQRDRDFQKSRAESLDKRLKNEQAASARLKKRVSVGVCPCCQRTVSQLARHMKTKHPEFPRPKE